MCIRDSENTFSASLELPVTPTKPLLVRFVPQTSTLGNHCDYALAAANRSAYIERDVELSHLPSLRLQITLPESYPSDAPPEVRLSTDRDWLPQQKLTDLESDAQKLWEEYGRCQVLFSFIDFLQQAAEGGFDLDQSADGCLVLSAVREKELVLFDKETKRERFNAGTYDCGICLEPKKGSSCYRMRHCGHVFCLQCLQDFYNNAITEGDIVGVRCLDPTCGKGPTAPELLKRRRKAERTLHPRELFAMGIEESMVRRYVDMKRKKKLEADKTTVYCPRIWCQGPARSPKYPPIPADLTGYVEAEASSDDSDTENATTKTDSPHVSTDRLAVCEKCALAFCRVCYMGWHGPFARCFPRDPNELSVEEKASYDYIRQNTSPCPTCSSPTQKTMGCNHMRCFQCNTHYCYLCGAWLEPHNPYQHFNKQGTECFQRLWELEEGDEGQAPGDGRGFAGGRRWEQLAMEVAQQADEEEAAEEAARTAQAEENAHVVEIPPAAPGVQDAPLFVAMAQIQLNEEPEPRAQPRPGRGGRRQQNPHVRGPPAHGAAQAVRNHERNRGRGRGGGHEPIRRRPAANNDEEERQQQELQRFLAMAQNDEEDGWDSDGLDEDDGRFEIR